MDYEISFGANSNSQVFANGLVGESDLGTFDLYKIDGTKLTSDGGVDLKVFHGVTDAPSVDVTLEDGTVLFGD